MQNETGLKAAARVDMITPPLVAAAANYEYQRREPVAMSPA